MKFLVFLLWVGLATDGEGLRSDQLRARAESLYDQEKYEESLKYYQQALAAVGDADPARAANLRNDMSSVYYSLRQFDLSIENCRQGIRILNHSANSGADSLYFKLYSSLGIMFHAKAIADSSSYYFLLSDELLRKNPVLRDQIPEYVLHHYLNQGRSVWRKHRFYDSIAYFERALELCRRKKMNGELYYIYGSLAEVHDLLGRHEEALSWRIKALNEVPRERIQARQSLYSGVGYTYKLLQKNDSARVWYGRSLEALSLFQSHNERYQTQLLYVLTELGSLHLQAGQEAIAARFLARGEAHLKKYGIVDGVLYSSLMLFKGNLEKALGREDEAQNCYNGAYEGLFPSGEPAGIGRSETDIKFPSYAIKILRAQAELFTERHKKENKLADLEMAFQYYNKLIRVKKSSYRQVIENQEDRYFYSADTRSDMESAILNGFEFFQKKQTAGVLNTLFNRMEDANTTYLMDKVTGTDATRQLELPEPMSIENVRQLIGGQSVYISYKLIDNQLVVLVISKGGAHVRKWPVNRKKFEADLEALMLEVKVNPGLGAYAGSAAAQKCYDVLLRPIADLTSGFKRWIVARDWTFSSLPFEVLEQQAGHYLADEYAFAYTYSAAFFWNHPFLKQQLPRKRDTFVFAPFVKDNSDGSIFDSWRPVSSMEEVKAIGQSHVSGREATKQRFNEQGTDHYILNLATHAFADLKNPNSSYVQFYPGIDSKLYMDEIMEMRLEKTRLVMLSSCFGNDGASYAGEGTVSLAYAFANAGCPSLITTTWEANENTISFLSLRVAEYIDEGLPLDVAVRKAGLDLRKDRKYGRYDHPYFWANLSLLGNNSPVYHKKLSFSRYWYLGLISLIIGLCLFLYRKWVRLRVTRG
ncbi:hypothetical protein GCM10023091_21270 [Ravibacter arvi]|uniref:CHAT domain-containing protein n=1 Tax=Ravibacter arvi TaxID=2051041 RepID=A0ABP8LZ58_9BACT